MLVGRCVKFRNEDPTGHIPLLEEPALLWSHSTTQQIQVEVEFEKA